MYYSAIDNDILTQPAVLKSNLRNFNFGVGLVTGRKLSVKALTTVSR